MSAVQRESKEQICKFLNKYYVKDLREVFSFVADLLQRNPDLLCAAGEYDDVRDGEDLLSMIGEDAGRAVEFTWHDVIAPHEMDVFREIYALAQKKDSGGKGSVARGKGYSTLRKAKITELLSEVFGSDTLSESFFLLLEIAERETADDDEDSGLAGRLAETVGCPERWKALAADPVYVSRREYGWRMVCYIKAAVNLYGCIHLSELAELIDGYEAPKGRRGRARAGSAERNEYGEYTRSEGGYRYTVMFTPQWRCTFTLRDIADNCTSCAGVTMDGLLVHGCYQEEMARESEKLVDYIRERGDLPDEQEMLEFFEEISEEIPYRLLYAEASEKEMYVPKSGKDFLRMAEDAEHPEAERKLESYLRRNHMDSFDAYAHNNAAGLQEMFRRQIDGPAEDPAREGDPEEEALAGMEAGDASLEEQGVAMEGEDVPVEERFTGMTGEDASVEEQFTGMTAEDALQLFLSRAEEITGNGPDCLDRDAMDIVREFNQLVNDFRIGFSSDADFETMIQLEMEISNNTRLWTNHGHTPAELAARYPVRPGQRPVIVPGSTEAAKILSQGRGELERMGIQLDLDSNADEIPVISMPQGVNGPVERRTQKIYPNDPCPCGSGKKYKKCCGRRSMR